MWYIKLTLNRGLHTQSIEFLKMTTKEFREYLKTHNDRFVYYYKFIDTLSK